MSTTLNQHAAEIVRATIEQENMLGNPIERRPRIWGDDHTIAAVREWAARIAPTFEALATDALNIADAAMTTETVQDATDLVAAVQHLHALASHQPALAI